MFKSLQSLFNSFRLGFSLGWSVGVLHGRFIGILDKRLTR